MVVDGQEQTGNLISVFDTGSTHQVVIYLG